MRPSRYADPMRSIGILAFVLVLAGCFGGARDDTAGTPTPTGPVYSSDASFDVNYNANQCRELFVVKLVEFAQAQRNLPAGYKAKDAQGLLGLPIAAGRAALWLNAATCSQSEFAIGGIDEGGYGVYVDKPTVAGDRPAADTDFYQFGRFTAKEEKLVMLRAVNYTVFEGSVDVTITPQAAGGAATAGGTVRNDEGARAFTMGGTAPASQPLKGRARFWHDTSNGTAYFDYVVDLSVSQGTGSCQVFEPAVRQKLGIETCGNDTLSLAFPPYKWEGKFTYLSDVHAT